MPISSIFVPNTGPDNARILFVGEAPGAKEEEARLPFVGESGDLLIQVIGRAGLSRSDVKLANLCSYRPLPDNKFERLSGSKELEAGIRTLREYIRDHQPTVIVPLGSQPLKILAGKDGISKWRGSIIRCLDNKNIKVVPTFHPAAVLRDRSIYPIFDLDIQRAVSESQYPEFHYPEYKVHLNPTGVDLEDHVERLLRAERLAIDIETVKKSRHILCVGFAPNPREALVIAPTTPHAEQSIRRLLESPIKKVFHFGTFDTIQLMLNGYEINNYWWDTLTAQHALAPELPASLAFLCSIYTRQPYYKKEGRGEIPGDIKGWSLKESKDKLYEYNATDVCVTAEIQLQQEKELAENKNNRATFDFEMEEIVMARAISMAGMLRDEQRRAYLEAALKTELSFKQFILNGLTGFETNVRSPALKKILYDEMKLPPRRNRGGGLTTDEDAIVSLIGYCKDHMSSMKTEAGIKDWKAKLIICQLILKIRGIRQLLSNYIMKPANDDGRVRSTYKVSGPETGRWAAERFVDSTGVNSQTFPREAIEVPKEVKENVDVQIDDDEAVSEGDSDSDAGEQQLDEQNSEA